jgi:hypothetical protein
MLEICSCGFYWISHNSRSCYCTLAYNLIKIRSLTCFPLLICHCMGDLGQPHYESQMSDLMAWIYNDMIIRLLVTKQSSLVTFSYSCNRHFHWPIHRVTRIWSVMRFPRISDTAIYRYMGVVRNRILMRLISMKNTISTYILHTL